MQGKKVGSAQYTRDADGMLLRKLEEIRDRWRRYFASLLNTTSVALDRTILEGLSPKSIALSLGEPPVVDEMKQAIELPSTLAESDTYLPTGYATVRMRVLLRPTTLSATVSLASRGSSPSEWRQIGVQKRRIWWTSSSTNYRLRVTYFFDDIGLDFKWIITASSLELMRYIALFLCRGNESVA